ncbi:MAG: IS256 family transposase [Desulfobacula sp.]|jgi:transposase-like protein|uniref:IS256 family transposase n=1 Tax=Desulfobacula sp. TaxID=2593537 RepID=UPI002A153F7E|nr:IS256 family transposase [Desulfobacula sp.]MBT5543771.1 IS256 family transposase [Desulfobacula sp.]MBT7791221.1 IS256 family transposase [Desulfobacula sp.]
MTQRQEDTAIGTVLEIINSNGLEGLGEAVSILINEAMKVERSSVLKAHPWERSDSRTGYANGYKNKSVATKLGQLDLNIPQVRGDVDFYPSALEKGLRSEKALKLAMAEMYIQGVSTRKVTSVLEKLCGLEISSTQVSNASKLLDKELEKWRTRAIPKISFLQLDARYEKVRQDGSVMSCAVLIATGVMEDGRRTVLGTSVSLSEAEVHWRDFLLSLKKRGLHGVELVTSDDHSGLKSALKSVFPNVPWQRCQVHLQRNATAYVPKVAMRKEVASDLRSIFNAPNKTEAQRLLEIYVEKYQTKASRLSIWMEENIPEGLTVFRLPEHQRKKLRSTNMVERLNKEIKRRTRVATLFPNEASLLRLVSSILVETSEEWETGRKYLSMSADS